MTSISSEKLAKPESEASEVGSVSRHETAKLGGYECEEPEEEVMSDYNLSDDEFTLSKRKRRKEPAVKKVIHSSDLAKKFISQAVGISVLKTF